MAEIKHFTLTNSKGESVVLSNFGASILAINVPDRGGRIDNVVLAYAKDEDYYDDGPFMGKTPGRYSNRIAKGHFTLDGKQYTLSINCGTEHLHGGIKEESYANRVWDAEQKGNSVVMSLFSPDGDAGYPGNLKVQATYTWDDDSCLTLDFVATTDAKTVVNLTNHVYFDLRGAGNKQGGILNHVLKLNCSRYLPTDDQLIPTGEIAPVAGTPMDFTKGRIVGKDIHDYSFPALKFGKGYDACWAIDDFDGSIKPIAELCEPSTGRKMVLSTNKPGVQLYTGNYLEGCPDGPGGYVYKENDGLALECQDFPDAPNHPNYGYKPLEPGETYHHTMKWQFSAE